MIPQQEIPPVFFYGYRPVASEFKTDPRDGGFTVTLYDDNRLVFNMLDLDNTLRSSMSYDMPSDLKKNYLALLDQNNNAIASLPGTLSLPEGRIARFVSSIGFSGYPYMVSFDIPQLCHLPFGDSNGRCGRLLCSLMEDMAQVFQPFGINLSLFGFDVDPSLPGTSLTPEAEIRWDTREIG